MGFKRRKQSYLSKLKKISSHVKTKIDVGISDIQNDRSLCFNKSNFNDSVSDCFSSSKIIRSETRIGIF